MYRIMAVCFSYGQTLPEATESYYCPSPQSRSAISDTGVLGHLKPSSVVRLKINVIEKQKILKVLKNAQTPHRPPLAEIKILYRLKDDGMEMRDLLPVREFTGGN